MVKKVLFCLILFLVVLQVKAQYKKENFRLGVGYGFGSEFSNKDYTFENHFYKMQLYYVLKKTKHFQYEILVQPEINFAKHQLLNFYFVKPEVPNFEEKRTEYTKLKDIREYVLNVGFLVRKPFNETYSVYVLGSVGPMITDTETERMSNGFAFADVLALGFSVNVKKLQFDVRPSIRHVSNAGLTSDNAGYNTKNIEFGILYQL
ncbi:acyloxyacyl hydrolase [Flavobacterium branchiicola]|uniref:Acyloxyacyl hydrolase n=1 Tax=Flavobacterium branchiicola TaxID=1114875 RepID=A0ABV9PK78_9FLAO|nr:acyloxyacyl hydrolase [Flavobacterium branchiicola]MBS7255959.1 acyloxyacyl hydrolase [Flavobacterium branchiicola]